MIRWRKTYMSKNLTYQMTSSIENALALGQDKHSAKKDGTSQGKIYSYATRKEMMDLAHDLSRFIKTEYPEVRMVKDINIEHINAYLKSKVGVTQATMQSYVARINKMEVLCSKKFPIKIDWRTGREVPTMEKETIRNCMISEKQVQGLEKYLDTKKDCPSKNAYYLAKAFALRAASITKLRYSDVNFETMKLHIHEDKGKRSRDIDIRPQDIPILQKVMEGKSGKDRLIELRPDSICAYLNRSFKQLGYTNLVDAKTSIHAIRKYSINQYYKEMSQQYGKKRAEEMCCVRLGHGADRRDIISHYLKK